MDKKLKIAVTGGIGSGKSAATAILKEKGYAVLSCDDENTALLKKRAVLKKIKDTFPFAVNGKLRLSLDKKALSERVFTDENLRKKLTDILHPLIMKSVFKKANKHRGVTFIEVPLLFESGLEKQFDGVIVIYADKEKRIQRVKTRSGLTDGEIEKRIAAQFNYDTIDKDKYCVICNDGNLEEFSDKVQNAVEKMISAL